MPRCTLGNNIQKFAIQKNSPAIHCTSSNSLMFMHRVGLGHLAARHLNGWSAGQVGRHVKCWRREWNGRRWPTALSYGVMAIFR